MKITTKTGDGGETGLFGGGRVKKNSAFMNCLGDLDELNSVLGWAKCGLGVESKDAARGKNAECLALYECLDRLQDDIYKIMSFVGFKFKWPTHIEPISELDVEFLEGEMAKYEEAVGGLTKFIRPGSNEAAARLHIARSVCRRAERSYVAVMEEQGSGGGKVRTSDKTGDHGKAPAASTDSLAVLKYLNRLSDLLFVMAYDKETS